MSTETLTLADFLLARIAEDEAVARACIWPAHDAPGAHRPHPELSRWHYADGGEVEHWQTPAMLAHSCPEHYYVTCDSEGPSPSVQEPEGRHIARHDPARVLDECEAKRRIVARHVSSYDARGVGQERDGAWTAYCEYDTESWPCPDARDLAAPYADHPDYRPEWRP